MTTNYTDKSAMWTALAGTALKGVIKLHGRDKRNQEIERNNRLKRKKHQAAIHQYNREFNTAVIAWKDDILNSRAAIREERDKALGEIAQTKLDIWNNIALSGNKQQAALAKMLSVGGGEQAGTRSAATIDPRKALLEYGESVARLGAELAGTNAKAALGARIKLDSLDKKSYNEGIKQALGRPIPGTPPQLFDEEFEPKESWASTALELGQAGLEGWRTYQTLKPPSAKEKSSSNNQQYKSSGYDSSAIFSDTSESQFSFGNTYDLE
tara:strand:- start:4304 stop:5107 length:804 start_codon:yes stop_codon:yes gene_type:complete